MSAPPTPPSAALRTRSARTIGARAARRRTAAATTRSARTIGAPAARRRTAAAPTCSGPTVGASADLAPIWRRILARATDLATVLFVQWALTVIHVFWFVGGLSDRLDPSPWGRAFVPTVLFVVLSAVYEVVFVRWNNGRTPGKDVWRVKIVRARDGERPGIVRALVRWAGPGLTILLWPLWLAGTVLVGWGLPALVVPGRRALHDLLAGTVVVTDQRDDDDDDAPPSRRRQHGPGGQA